jgi:putative protease
MHILEILAPAGSYDALIAAVENGADAVYLGGKQFSARASADNFGDLELENAVEYAHLRNVRIYVTVNILIDNSEIKDVMEYIKKLYNLGVDGIIVQDLGLLSLIRKLLPHMRLHASTQMTVHNLEGVKFLEGLGVKRVVISRELSLTEINSIAKQTSLELEVFGHGALCVSYSGQCLMSSLIGTRSGNRGRCAQPCRMAYALVDKSGNEVESKKIGAHLLSPKDLNTLELLPEICSSGIASLKLEGRMKRPEYVATVVQIYRQVLDRLKTNPENFCVSQEEHQKLAQIFNRDFTSGYLKGNPSRDLMSYKRPNNRGIRLGRIERIIDQGRLAEIKLDERLRIGDGVEIWVTKGGRQGYYVNEISRNGVQIDEAEKGDIVSVNIIGKPKVGDRVFKTHDITLIEKAQQSYLKPVKNIPIDLNFQAKEGSPFTLEGLDDEGNSVLYTSTYIVARAKKHPATNETVLQQLSRLGGTGYKIGKVLLDIEEAISFARNIKGVEGVLLIKDDKMAAWGEIELVSLKTT